MVVHVAKDGDHIHGIAAAAGFRRVSTVWNAPENANLRALRPNPDTLLPGDRVTVPDFTSQTDEGATEKRHRFVALTQRTAVRLRWLRFGHTADAQLQSAFEPTKTPTPPADGAGDVTVKIDATTSQISVSTPRGDTTLQVGFLHPFDTESGWLARLHNLGYLASSAIVQTQIDAIELASAIEEFQCDHGLTVDGQVQSTFLSALRDAHGC
ncbi:MAG: peptidoglycan-binding protein [Polyangiaceae bacterium]|nr:peptidoglycan-binding protein [Polyangiaceae bacterium]